MENCWMHTRLSNFIAASNQLVRWQKSEMSILPRDITGKGLNSYEFFS